MDMLETLKKERDSLIFQLQSAVEMDNYTSVAYISGMLVQTQDLIKQVEEAEGMERQ